jgi:hypothetical protein
VNTFKAMSKSLCKLQPVSPLPKGSARLGHLFLFMAQQPLLGQGLLIVEASRSHTDTLHSEGLLWKRDEPEAETST